MTGRHWYAASDENEAVVRPLLAREEVDPNRQNEQGQSPLNVAVENRHGAVIRQLLARKDINVKATTVIHR